MNLQTKIIAATSAIVVTLGLVTIAAINTVVSRTLTRALTDNGLALTEVTGEAVANALLDGDLLTVHETLNNLKATSPNVVYAYAFGPVRPTVVHTFAGGFPSDLLSANRVPSEVMYRTQRLTTESGVIQDIGWRPLDGLNAEIHVGLSEAGLRRTLAQVTWVVAGLTVAGMFTGVIAAVAFGRFVTRPLIRLTTGVRRLGAGHLEESIPDGGRDEIGGLSRAFNQMAADLRASIGRLSASEASARALIEAAGEVGEGIALVRDEGGGRGTFVFVNDEFSRLTGYPREQLLDLNAAEVIHPQSVDDVYEAWQSIRVNPEATLRHEMTLMTRDGRKVIVETGGTLIEYEGHRALAWFMLDITERKTREAEILRRNRELAALQAVSTVMSGTSDVDASLQRALEQALAALELPAGWVFVTSAGDQPPRLTAVAGLTVRPGDPPLQFPRCDCGRVLQTQQPIVAPLHEGCAAWHAVASDGVALGCHATVPLVAGGRVVGALSAAAASPAAFDEADFRLLGLVGRQMAVALENARLWHELQEKERLRAELLAKAIQAQEDERRRIARELHDETGQSLNAMLFGLKTAEAAVETDTQQARTVITRLKAAADDNVRELQSIIYDLRPSLLDDLGLTPALRWYAESRLESHGVRINWLITGSERRLPPEVETALFRISQEAMTNIARHSGASQVDIHLSFEAARVLVEIADNGQGFEVESVLAHRSRDGRGLGLLGMRERVELLGGTFELASTPGEATRIRVVVPVPEHVTGPLEEADDAQDPCLAG